MIPERFVVEYPERCMQLLEMLEPAARKEKLLGSFSLLVASSIFVIPYERMKKQHPLRERQGEPELYKAIKRIERQLFTNSEIWGTEKSNDWRMSRILQAQDNTNDWKDEGGLHPMNDKAENTIARRKTGEVLRVIRNALAHGNVVYLDQKGFECRGNQVQYLAFLSRYEDEAQREKSETYRLVATTEENFLMFVKCWARWLQSFPADYHLAA